MRHIISLLVGLSLFWELLSGYLSPFLLLLGLLSVGLVVWVVHRLEVLDEESVPIHLSTVRWLRYCYWLLGEIIKSNLDVTKRILQREPDISPTIVRLKATQHSDIGRVIYANSITLTPGTVTMSLKGDELEVHAISREGAESLKSGDMDRRVTDLEVDD